ncbi:MAG: 50S ribosomal protein L9 [Coriobacteriaceae bacterium]|nr:50S ribosomal protein L9 [Coriobacteriaceae bacterium]
MKVILLSELKGKGGEGDVVEVARGFANNYLLPQGIAIKATPGNLKQLEMRRKNIAKREEVRLADAAALKAQLDAMKVKVDAKVGEEGVLFGSVTPAMIADAVKAQFDIELDRKRIDLRNPIKVAGEHQVAVSLYREIKATLTVFVGAEGEAIPTDEPEAEVEEVVEETVEAAEEAEEATEE